MSSLLGKKTISLPVSIKKGGKLPQYFSTEAAGADVYACLDESFVLLPGKVILVPTGLRFAIPEGFEIQVRSRSGLALKHGIIVLNSPGTIDSDYRGEVGIILVNHGSESFTITPGMRIAQIILAPVFQAEFVIEDFLEKTARNEGGFGHTGEV